MLVMLAQPLVRFVSGVEVHWCLRRLYVCLVPQLCPFKLGCSLSPQILGLFGCGLFGNMERNVELEL